MYRVSLQWDRKNRQDRDVTAKLAQVERVKEEREEVLRDHLAEGRVTIAPSSMAGAAGTVFTVVLLFRRTDLCARQRYNIEAECEQPNSLAPVLNQVFYIGDGKSGFNNAAGPILDFLAPTNATRLYLGVADGCSLSGPAGYFSDKRGQYNVNVQLANVSANDVPEPASLTLLGLGTLALTAARNRRAT